MDICLDICLDVSLGICVWIYVWVYVWIYVLIKVWVIVFFPRAKKKKVIFFSDIFKTHDGPQKFMLPVSFGRPPAARM